MGTVDGFGDGVVSLADCIVWGNTSVGTHVSAYENAVVTATYSCIEGGWPGDGNIDADPRFVSPGCWDDSGTPGDTSDDVFVAGDYHLSASSPCIDAGDPASTVTEDIEGNPRSDARVDMGAYEFHDGLSGLAVGAGCAAAADASGASALHCLLTCLFFSPAAVSARKRRQA
jgi:hypothetical protein